MTEGPVCPGNCAAKVAVLEDQMVAMKEHYKEIDKKLDQILEQTTRHNGRLTRVEGDLKRNFEKDESRDEHIHNIDIILENYKQDRWFAGKVIGAVIILLPILFSVFKSVVNYIK
jgi:hypothetical protein